MSKMPVSMGFKPCKGSDWFRLRRTWATAGSASSFPTTARASSPGKLREMLVAVRSENVSGSSIGIRNVYRRFELYYRDQVRFDISSKLHQGTEVSFAIPIKLLEHQEELDREA